MNVKRRFRSDTRNSPVTTAPWLSVTMKLARFAIDAASIDSLNLNSIVPAGSKLLIRVGPEITCGGRTSSLMGASCSGSSLGGAGAVIVLITRPVCASVTVRRNEGIRVDVAMPAL